MVNSPSPESVRLLTSPTASTSPSKGEVTSPSSYFMIGDVLERKLRQKRKQLQEQLAILCARMLSMFFTRKVSQLLWDPALPLVSVVIPSYNYGRFIEAALDSVLAQTFQNIEIIVVDGGSTDPETRHVLETLSKPKTTVYLREGRHLVGDNRNYGISCARGKYICCLDSDDLLKPAYLEKALLLLESRDLDIVSCAVQFFYETPGDMQKVWVLPRVPTLAGMLRRNQFATVAVFKKSLWEKSGGYKDYGPGKDYVAEDREFWTRLLALGAKGANLQEPLMLYRRHALPSLSRQPDIPNFEEQARQIQRINQALITHCHLFRSNFKNKVASTHMIPPWRNLFPYLSVPILEKNILIALPYCITGGANTIQLKFLEALKTAGYGLVVVTTLPAEQAYGNHQAAYEALTPHVFPLPDIFPDTSLWEEFTDYLIQTRKISHLLMIGSAYFYTILPRLKAKYPALRIVDQLYNEFGHLASNRKYARWIDLNIVATEKLAALLTANHSKASDADTTASVRYIRHGVDALGEFNPEYVETDALYEAHPIPKGAFIVSFIGRLSREKQPEAFVAMAERLNTLENIFFVMIGHGPRDAFVRKAMTKCDLGNKFYAPGLVADIRPFLKLSDVLVMPSLIEGIPIILMEALAMETPCVASDVGGIPSAIAEGKTGYLCNPHDMDAFCKKIEWLHAHPEALAEMKRNARRAALSELSLEKMNQEYVDAFHHLP